MFGDRRGLGCRVWRERGTALCPEASLLRLTHEEPRVGALTGTASLVSEVGTRAEA